MWILLYWVSHERVLYRDNKSDNNEKEKKESLDCQKIFAKATPPRVEGERKDINRSMLLPV